VRPTSRLCNSITWPASPFWDASAPHKGISVPTRRQGAAYGPWASLRSRRIIRFNAHSVVDGRAQSLLAAEVAFCRLDREVSKQKLDLIQLPTGKMAEPRAVPTHMPHSACEELCRMPDYAESLPRFPVWRTVRALAAP
jgi:hypothetical protein